MTEKNPVVFLIDDDLSVRDALDGLLRSVGLQVQSFGSVQEFLRAELSDAPACLVLDVRLPGPSGLDFQRDLAESNSPLPIISVEVSPQHLGALERLALLDAGERDKACIAWAVERFLDAAPQVSALGIALWPADEERP